MYLEKLPEKLFTTTLVKIRYDCCKDELELEIWSEKEINSLGIDAFKLADQEPTIEVWE